ncbi:magnesium transporter CorA [Pseudaminobacter sp. 19-2017]|uniref:Magnesium transporter CorA n=1 Tax=Pseudaminobacter soli (ex Zhang et al. 2022) TaxID=2831468 RepID=A0A942I9T5_9HYPH|nr:CorA family divalent cation transporter [Pseudaminobacter soli]MBS3650645.1 magnesium transporter CorA [Pseudaminobacter soli]
MDSPASNNTAVIGLLPDSHGLFFTYHFDEAGFATDDANTARWIWRSYDIGDLRARHEISAEPAMPAPVKSAFLSSAETCHVDLDEGWLHGDLPDLRHDESVETRGLAHFRFAFNERMLIGARKQQLRSVSLVRAMVESRSRPFRAPAELISAILLKSLDGLAADLTGINEQLDGVEDRIVCDEWQRERQPLVGIRRKLVMIHRRIAGLTNLFRHLDLAHRDDLSPALAEMTDRLSHQTMMLNHDSEQLQARARLLQEEVMARLTAQSNRLLYLLSVLTAVLLPMSIISGLFGMNVGGLPFMGDNAGFWTVTLLSVLVAATTLYFVRRLGSGL